MDDLTHEIGVRILDQEGGTPRRMTRWDECVLVGFESHRTFVHYLLRYQLLWWSLLIAIPLLFVGFRSMPSSWRGHPTADQIEECQQLLPYVWWSNALVCAIIACAARHEISVVQKLGLLPQCEIRCGFPQSQLFLVAGVSAAVSRADVYFDVFFICVARDCGSHLWWASLAVFTVGFVVGHIFLTAFFAVTDCDQGMAQDRGFLLLDFRIINSVAFQSARLSEKYEESAAPWNAFTKPQFSLRTSLLISSGQRCLCVNFAQAVIKIIFLTSSFDVGWQLEALLYASVFLSVVNSIWSLATPVRNTIQAELEVQDELLRTELVAIHTS